MKKIMVLISMLSVMASAEFAWQTDLKSSTKTLSEAYVSKMDKEYTIKMCKICIGKANAYKETMKDDAEAVEILDEYKRRLSIYCGPIMSAEQK